MAILNKKWITGNYFLTQQEMENNAAIITLRMLEDGWTYNAIAGMLGNMQYESSINPGIWQDLTPFTGGYGLVQWTPYTNYSEWAGEGWEDNGEKELERILYEKENGLQYIPTSEYPLTFPEFSVSEEEPEYLAYAWLYNYERPESLDQPDRATAARSWYEYIQQFKLFPWIVILAKRRRFPWLPY